MILPFQTLYDSHCHLNDSTFDSDRADVVAAAQAAGVQVVIDMAESLNSSRLAVENAQKFPGVVLAAVGVDPHAFIPKDGHFQPILISDDAIGNAMQEVRSLAQDHPKEVIMLGETGMDDYWYRQESMIAKLSELGTTREEMLGWQEKLFRAHLELSVDLHLPLSVHSRGAEQRCLEIAQSYPDARGIFHSYTGDYNTAKGILDAGWGLGMNGIVTFKNSQELQNTYRKLLGKVSPDSAPVELYAKGIYLETDAPYLSPEGKRSQRNQPANIAIIWQWLLENFR